MATAQLQGALQEKVIDYLQDMHALEQNVLRMLDSMIATTHDDEALSRLRQHRAETERHEQIVRRRLEALGAGPALTAEVPALMGAWLKGLTDKLRPDKPGRNARDGYVTEHLEIAAYKLLERLAERAGDHETAEAARAIRRDEEEMARWIDGRWDRFIDLTLSESGPHPGHSRGDFLPRTGFAARDTGRSRRGDNLLTDLAGSVGWAAGLGVAGYLLYQLMGSSRPSAPRYERMSPLERDPGETAAQTTSQTP